MYSYCVVYKCVHIVLSIDVFIYRDVKVSIDVFIYRDVKVSIDVFTYRDVKVSINVKYLYGKG